MQPAPEGGGHPVKEKPQPMTIPASKALLACALLGLCFGPAGTRADDPAQEAAAPALIFGLLPSESAVAKFKRYAPLRDYLAARLRQRVVLETARNFPEFIKRTRERKYDFLETAPHFVPSAIDSGHYQVLTTITQPLSAQVVVHENSPYQQVSQLAGRKVATPSPKAVITRIGKQALVARGLHGQSQPVYMTYRTHNAAYQAVLGQQADAAIISVNVYNKALRKSEPLRSIAASEAIPNMSIVVARDLPSVTRQTLEEQLVGMQQDPRGREVLKKTAYPGYRKADIKEYESLRRYLE
jgi:phosphonate transport system substrate-binding protein